RERRESPKGYLRAGAPSKDPERENNAETTPSSKVRVADLPTIPEPNSRGFNYDPPKISPGSTTPATQRISAGSTTPPTKPIDPSQKGRWWLEIKKGMTATDVQSYLKYKMEKVNSFISPNPFLPPPPITGSSGVHQAPPAKKKARILPPSPPSNRPPPLPKDTAKPKAVPVDSRPSPKDAPAVSVARPRRRRATHTTRGLTRRGLYLVPPAGS